MSSSAIQALKLSLIYLIFGLAWIYFSDRALLALANDVELFRQLQTWKGTVFVLVTAALFFGLSWQALKGQSLLVERLERSVHRNALSGLPNRRGAELQLDRAIERARRSGGEIGLVALDIDRFSDINDSFGYAVGNELLLAVTERIRSLCESKMSVAHASADEFLIILESAAADESIERLVASLQEDQVTPFAVDGTQRVHVTASMGSCIYPADARDSERLLQCADAALSRAKRQGPGSHARFDKALVERARALVQLDGELRRALADGELTLHYQPIVACRSGRPKGFEALMRWEPPGREPIPPSRFIPVAERSGLIIELGDWAIDQAAAQVAEWRRAGLGEWPVAVNLSARQFEGGRLERTLAGAIEKHAIPARLLNLEITESLLLGTGQQAIDALAALREHGFRVALDDFGTGYSSLAYLKDLPVDTFKIDCSFVRGLDRLDNDRNLVDLLIRMARVFELEVVAEGVETEAQLAILRELGCDYCQGFLFGKARPADKVGALAASSGQSE